MKRFIREAALVAVALTGWFVCSPASVAASIPVKAGDPAPDFTVKSITGKTIRLSALRGKVVVLDFWTTT